MTRARVARGPAGFHVLVPNPAEHAEVTDAKCQRMPRGGRARLGLTLPLIEDAARADGHLFASRPDGRDRGDLRAADFHAVILSTPPRAVSGLLYADLSHRVAQLGLPLTNCARACGCATASCGRNSARRETQQVSFRRPSGFPLDTVSVRGSALLWLLLIIGRVAGCASSGQHAATLSTSTPATASAPPATTTAGVPGALQAEANATAAGDIPDNQVFLVFRNRPAGYAMKYPEGWAQQGAGPQAPFRDKNNIVRIVVASAPPPTTASVQKEVGSARMESAPQRLTISGHPAYKVVYSTQSAPNAVTGKRVKLVVDRYYLWNGGHRAVVDLGTPEGVDNVDAYRLMIESFRWT